MKLTALELEGRLGIVNVAIDASGIQPRLEVKFKKSGNLYCETLSRLPTSECAKYLLLKVANDIFRRLEGHTSTNSEVADLATTLGTIL